MAFPSYFALSAHTNHKIKSELFLTYIPEGQNKDYLQVNPTAEVPSLIARFVVERARDRNLVHIRSCYNNKYWRRKGSCVVADVSERQEDTKEDDCTLFRPTWFGSEITLTHVKSGVGLGLYTRYYSYWFLYLSGNESVRFKVVDYEMLVRLPKRVIFYCETGRWPQSGWYLRGQWRKPCPTAGGIRIAGLIGIVHHEMSNACEFNEFFSRDGADRSAHYEIIHYNGFIRIKSLYFGKFLRASNDAGKIYGDEDDNNTINKASTLFEVNNMGNNWINLRNLGNNKVCTRMSTGEVDDCLFASESYGVPASLLLVDEPVRNRRVHVQYKLDDARITSEYVTLKYAKPFTNNSKDRADEYTINIEIQKSRTTKWSKTNTVTKGVKAEINKKIPILGNGKFELSVQVSQAETFEEQSTFSETTKDQYKIVVPPMSKVLLKNYRKEVTYDIPYSSFQTDVYTTGETETISAKDGICQGFESFDYYDKEEIPLSSTKSHSNTTSSYYRSVAAT